MARAFQLSSGLKNYLFGTDDLVAALNTSGAAGASGCAVLLFQGAIPANADAATTGDLLCTIKDGSDFVTWEADTANKTVKKVAAETWSGVVGTATNETLTHFRIVMDDADDGTSLSTTAKRIQGTIGTDPANFDLYMSQPVVNTSDVKTLAAFVISILDA
jgi:hypothetical protein